MRLINLKYPKAVEEYFKNMDTLTTMNLNFSFTNPLSYVGNAFSSENSSAYKKFGIITPSFLYNAQSPILIIAMGYAIVILFYKISSRFSNSHKRIIIRISNFAFTVYSSKQEIVSEMYYQIRFSLLVYAFHHLCMEVPLIPKLIPTVGTILMLMLIFLDYCFSTIVFKQALSSTLTISIAANCQLNAEDTNSIWFIFATIVSHPLIAMIICCFSFIPKIQLILIGIVAIIDLVILLWRTQMQSIKHKVNYCVGYLCIVGYCSALYGSIYFKNSIAIFGFIMTGFLTLPLIISILLFLPAQIKDLITAIKKLKKKK